MILINVIDYKFVVKKLYTLIIRVNFIYNHIIRTINTKTDSEEEIGSHKIRNQNYI